MRNETATQSQDTCHVCGAYDLEIEILNGQPYCEDCADAASAAYLSRNA